MILAVDVDYRNDSAYIGGITFDNWNDSNEKKSYISILGHVNDYIPGQFYLRELPCILELIDEYKLQPDYIVIDGFVYLDAAGKPGLGKHLYDALNRKVVIIGVAKKSYAGIPLSCQIFRGSSGTPLYVTSVGVALEDAKILIQSMHGEHRIPTLLKRVDRISRQHDM